MLGPLGAVERMTPMTDSKAPARPAQVTLAAWVAMVGSVFVVFYAFSVVANLRTRDTRERVEETIDVPPGSWLGLGVEGYLDLIHVAAMVAAGCAVAIAILGWHVRARNRSARVALTILAVPLLVAGTFTDGFMSSMVAFSAVFLWLKPSRDWFDGIAPTGSTVAQEAPRTPVVGSSPGPPPPAAAYAPQRPAFSTSRPSEVLQACLITWILAGLVLLVTVFGVMGVLVAPDAFRDAYNDSAQADDLAFDDARRAILVAGTAFAVWSLAAILVAVFAFLGRNWARVALLVSAAAAAVACLLFAAGATVLLIPMAGCGIVVALLLRPSVVAWYTRRF